MCVCAFWPLPTGNTTATKDDDTIRSVGGAAQHITAAAAAAAAAAAGFYIIAYIKLFSSDGLLGASSSSPLNSGITPTHTHRDTQTLTTVLFLMMI